MTTGVSAVAGSALSARQHLPAVHRGQAEVQQHDRGRAAARRAQPRFAVGGDGHGEAGVLQIDRQQVGGAAVVLDDQHLDRALPSGRPGGPVGARLVAGDRRGQGEA